MKVIALLRLKFGASSCVLFTLFSLISRNRVLYTHSLTHKHWHTHTLVHRQVPSCSFDAPPAKWSCCFLAPVTVETADCITSAHQRGTARWREKPSLHPFICLLQWWPSPLFFCPPCPPSSPLLRLLCPHHCHPLSSKTWKMKGKKSDRSTVSNLAENVTHASEHKILPRPSHWPQSKSEEAYLNAAFMTEFCSGSRKKFSPFFCLIRLSWNGKFTLYQNWHYVSATIILGQWVNMSVSARIYRPMAHLDCNVTRWWNCCSDNGQETNLRETVQVNIATAQERFTFSSSWEQNWTELNDIWLMLYTEYLFKFFHFSTCSSEKSQLRWGRDRLETDVCVAGHQSADPEVIQSYVKRVSWMDHASKPGLVCCDSLLMDSLQIEMPEAWDRNNVSLIFWNKCSTNVFFWLVVK